MIGDEKHRGGSIPNLKSFSRNCQLTYSISICAMLIGLLAIVAVMINENGGVRHSLSVLYLTMYAVPFACIFATLGYRWGKLRFRFGGKLSAKEKKNLNGGLKRSLLKSLLSWLLGFTVIVFSFNLLFFNEGFHVFVKATGIGNPIIASSILSLFYVRIAFIGLLISSLKLRPNSRMPIKIVKRAEKSHALLCVTASFITAALVSTVSTLYGVLFFAIAFFISIALGFMSLNRA